MIRILLVPWVAVMFANSSLAQEELSSRTYDLCARGLNNEPATPFIQTLRVRVVLAGPTIEDSVRRTVLAQLIKTMVWKDRASAVYVEDFDAAECAASAGNESEIAVQMTQADINAIRQEIGRGPGTIALRRETSRQPNEARARARLQALLHEKLDADELNGLLAEGEKLSESEACGLALEA
jgi:hypothetical protein